MATPVAAKVGGARVEATAKFIRGFGLAELILGYLLAIAATIYGNSALKHFSPPDASFWTLLSSPKVLSALHLTWVAYLAAFFLIWHGILGRRLQRPLRPIGFAVGTLLSLKCVVTIALFGAVRVMIDSVNVTVNGSPVNLGAQFGIYLDLIIGGVMVLALLAVCFAWFCANQETRKALESLDQARYTLDSIPLSIFLGFVLFVCLGYGYLTDLIDPHLSLAGIHLSPMLQRVTLLAFATICLLAAWGFYTGRRWGWLAGAMVGIAWTVSGYYPPSDMSGFSGPGFDKYRDFIAQVGPTFHLYIVFDDVLIFAGLALFIGFLVYVRRYLEEEEPALRPSKPRRTEVPVYVDWSNFKTVNKSWLIFGILGLFQWVQHDYLLGMVFLATTILSVAGMLMGIFLPRCIFRDEGFALPGVSLLVTPTFPYTSFKSVQFITTRKPPKGMRSIEDGVLNLNVSMFSDDQRALLKKEFKKRDISVTVLESADDGGANRSSL